MLALHLNKLEQLRVVTIFLQEYSFVGFITEGREHFAPMFTYNNIKPKLVDFEPRMSGVGIVMNDHWIVFGSVVNGGQIGPMETQ